MCCFCDGGLYDRATHILRLKAAANWLSWEKLLKINSLSILVLKVAAQSEVKGGAHSHYCAACNASHFISV